MVTKPTQGQPNWDVSLNAALDDLQSQTTNHAGAADPHGDRAYANATFVPLTGDVVGRARAVYKGADEQVVSSTVVQDDDHLTLTVVANGVYAFDACLLFDSTDVNADLSLTFAGPAGATGWWSPAAITLSNPDGTGSIRLTKFDLGGVSGIGAIAAGSLAVPRGYLAVGATAGSLKLQWAQSTSSATAVTMRTGSWLRAHRIA